MGRVSIQQELKVKIVNTDLPCYKNYKPNLSKIYIKKAKMFNLFKRVLSHIDTARGHQDHLFANCYFALLLFL